MYLVLFIHKAYPFSGGNNSDDGIDDALHAAASAEDRKQLGKRVVVLRISVIIENQIILRFRSWGFMHAPFRIVMLHR